MLKVIVYAPGRRRVVYLVPAAQAEALDRRMSRKLGRLWWRSQLPGIAIGFESHASGLNCAEVFVMETSGKVAITVPEGEDGLLAGAAAIAAATWNADVARWVLGED